MKIILTSPVGKRFMIRPSSSGLDFEIFKENPNLGKPKTKGKNKGEASTQEWISLGSYANNIPHALSLAVGFMMRDPDDPVTITGAADDIKSIEKCLKQYIKRIAVQCQREE